MKILAILLCLIATSAWAQVSNQQALSQVGSTHTRTSAEIAAGVTPTNYGYLPSDVRRYGADPTNTNDSTTAINNAMLPLTSGGVVTIPKGTYKFSTLTVPAGVVLRGEGWFATTLLSTSVSGTSLTLGAASGVLDMQVGASVTKTGGFSINVQANGALIQRVQFTGYFIAVNVGTLSGALPANTQILDCNFFNPVIVAGGGGILVSNASNTVIDGVVMSGPALPATQPDFGLRLQNGDTAFISNTNITIHGKALVMDPPAGFNFFAAEFSNDVFDSAGSNSGGAVSSATLQPAGNVKNTKFSNVWFGLSQSKFGLELAPSGAGTIDGLACTGCEFIKNGDSGVIINGAGNKNIVFSGGAAGGNTNFGYRLAGAATYITITGATAGNYSNRGANAWAIGVDGGAAADFYFFSNNNVQGNTNATGISDGGTGTHAQVRNNAGYNGATNASAVTVGASPFTYTAGHTPEEHWVFGGTVSSVTVDGTQIATATGVHVHLEPNEAYTITYTVAPTVVKKLT